MSDPASGVGRALCQRLLQEDDGLHLCLACRHPGRAEAARAALLAARPCAQVTVVQVDVGDLRSVLRAARELRHRWVPAGGLSPRLGHTALSKPGRAGGPGRGGAECGAHAPGVSLPPGVTLVVSWTLTRE